MKKRTLIVRNLKKTNNFTKIDPMCFVFFTPAFIFVFFSILTTAIRKLKKF